jgi:regulator of replication initiation timing
MNLLLENQKLQSENEKLKVKWDSVERYKVMQESLMENQKLRERVGNLRDAIHHVHKYAAKEFGWGDLLNQALAQDDEAAK